MIFLALEAVLFLAGVAAAHLHGLPLLLGAGAMALLYFLSSILFRLAGVAGLLLLPWSALLAS